MRHAFYDALCTCWYYQSAHTNDHLPHTVDEVVEGCRLDHMRRFLSLVFVRYCKNE